jgi:uncharacterized phage-associated protein
MSGSVSAEAVANEFLKLGWSERNVPSIDQMKLQKLLFYANAWYLAYESRPLFEENFEAWPWGPVLRDIYNKTSKYGSKPIDNLLYEISIEEINNPPFLKIGSQEASLNDSKIKDFIKSVWDVHKHYTGIQLSNSTHEKGEPWTLVKEQYGSLNGKPTIPAEIIENVYKRKIERMKARDA